MYIVKQVIILMLMASVSNVRQSVPHVQVCRISVRLATKALS